MRAHILLLFVLAQNLVWSQDTLSVYFAFGSTRIQPSEQTQLTQIPIHFDVSSLDSVLFIGYADSVGNRRANVRLSEKRATAVAKYCKKTFAGVPNRIAAKGEGSHQQDEVNRRVDILLFYDREIPSEKEEILESTDPRCFYVDFHALRYCHVRTVKKRKKEYVMIEALPLSYFKNTPHYFVKDLTAGNLKIQRLRWKKKTTGRLWWKKERLVATLPKKSFDHSQFFTLSDPPCDGCKEELLAKDTFRINVLKYYPDVFLMSNMQSKPRFLRRNQFKIRTPKEYVDLSDTYYASTTTHSPSRQVVQWVERSGRRKKEYYYARLYTQNGYSPYLLRARYTTLCLQKQDPDSLRYLRRPPCLRYSSRVGFDYELEVGGFYSNDSITGYIAGGLTYQTRITSTSLLIGINTHLGFYGTLRSDFALVSFPMAALHPVHRWQSAADLVLHSYGQLYAGGALKTSFQSSYASFFEGNVHLGIQYVRTGSSVYFPKFFLHGGLGYDLLQRTHSHPYPFLEAGLILRFTPLFR